MADDFSQYLVDTPKAAPKQGDSDFSQYLVSPEQVQQKHQQTAKEAFQHLFKDPLGYLKHVGKGVEDIVAGPQSPGARFKAGMAGQPLVPSEQLIPEAAGMAGFAETGGIAGGRGIAPVRDRAPPAKPPITPAEIDARVGVPREGAPPREVAQEVGQAVAAKKPEMVAAKDKAYTEAFEAPGEFHASVLEGVGTKIKGEMGRDPTMVVDDISHPQTSKAIKYLDSGPSQFKIQNRVGPQMAKSQMEDISAVSPRGIKQIRENLNKFYGDTSPIQKADRRAMKELISKFDDHLEDSITKGLFSGDPKFLEKWKDARTQDANIRKLFEGKSAENKALREMANPETTPETIGRYLYGTGKVGMDKVPVKIWGQLEQLFGKDSELLQKYKNATWEHAKEQKGGPAALANSTIGNKMFDVPTLQLMRQYEKSGGKTGLREEIQSRIMGHIAGRIAKTMLPLPGVGPLVKKAVEVSVKRYGGTD